MGHRINFVAAATIAALLGATPVTAQTKGAASVIDGDTIEMHGQRIRLSGFDTPESGTRCGSTNVYQWAALALSDFIGTKSVSCIVTGKDGYGRASATRSVGVTDLGDSRMGARLAAAQQREVRRRRSCGAFNKTRNLGDELPNEPLEWS